MKKILNCFLILFSRTIDLYTTQLGLVNFQNEEQNFLVKLFNLNFHQFCVVEILIAFILIVIYLCSVKNDFLFDIKAKNFFSFSRIFFYDKEDLSNFDLFFKMSFKRVLILFGSITPAFVFITSSIYSLNNLMVYLYLKGNITVMVLYEFLDK